MGGALQEKQCGECNARLSSSLTVPFSYQSTFSSHSFIPDLRKEQISEFSSHVANLVMESGFVQVNTMDKKSFSLFQLGDQQVGEIHSNLSASQETETEPWGSPRHPSIPWIFVGCILKNIPLEVDNKEAAAIIEQEGCQSML